MTVEEIENIVREKEDKLLVLKTENAQNNKEINNLKNENKVLYQSMIYSVDAVELVEKLAFNERMKIKTEIENVVSGALRMVYGDYYSIKFDYSVKANKTSVDVILEKTTSNGVVRRKMNGFGGGVADTIALPLKFMVLNACQVERVLIVDEPGKHIDRKRILLFASFLKMLCDKLKIQIIMSSHHQAVLDFADNHFQFTINKQQGETVIE